MNPTDTLTQIATNLKTDLLNSLQAKGSATSQTGKQITITNTDNGIQLDIPGYFLILEKGRGPTGKSPVAGNPPMIQRIQQWCREKGISDKAAWAIKRKIDKVGYPAKPGILTEPLGDDNIDQRLNQSLPQMADDLTNEILNALNI
jgi:hypothetical protein